MTYEAYILCGSSIAAIVDTSQENLYRSYKRCCESEKVWCVGGRNMYDRECEKNIWSWWVRLKTWESKLAPWWFIVETSTARRLGDAAVAEASRIFDARRARKLGDSAAG